ncbi:MAG: glycine cleavage system protein GcvH [Chloroflexi bacterium]|nr:glycine cleavage system protein GcvH [Chloroflexota bacterium]
MKLLLNARYAKTHEWALKDGDEFLVGITDYAQDSLSDIVYVELPEVGDVLDKGENFGVVESVKTASDVYMPVSGEIVAVNEALEDTPELVNQSPYKDGWMLRIRPSDPSEFNDLLDGPAYESFVAAEEG